MNDATIYSPCQVFEVRVTVALGASLSPVEQHVLRAAAAGIDTVSGLCTVLGLSSRIMVDLLGDLWHSGHISIDLEHERVWVTQDIRDRIADDALDSLPGAEISDEQRPMMLDTLTGLVTPVRGMHKPGSGRLEVPAHPATATLDSIERAALVEAVDRSLHDESAAEANGRQRRVLRAYLSPAALTTPTVDRRFRPLAVKVALDSDDRLIVRLADEMVPGRYRDAAQARLIQVIEDQPESSFTRALRDLAGGRPEEPTPLADALGTLADEASALAAAAPGTRHREQARMTKSSKRVGDRLRSMAEQESGVTLLTGRAEHQAAISGLIRDARKQIVLACPWVNYEGFSAYSPMLEEAARRGVQVVLLWGIGHEDVHGDEISNALNELRRQGGGHRVLITPHVSSRTHAKVVICDSKRALVTSFNFLQPSGPGTHETGIQVEALTGRRNPAIMEMLGWAREAMPDYNVAQSIIVDEESLPADPQDTVHKPSPLAEVPPLTDTAAADALSGAAATAWATAWQRHIDELAADALQLRPAVRMIRNGEHRDLLQTALRTARNHLLISSDGLTEDVVDLAFAEEVERCVARGVQVTLVYRRARREAGERAAKRLAAVAQSTASCPGQLTVVNTNNHAKVLVVDDESVVTSFNFLSFEGYYAGVGRHRQRSEVGLRIYSRRLARQLLASFGAAAGSEDADGTDPASAPQSAGQDGATRVQMRAFSVAQRLLDLLSGTEPVSGERIAELARSSEDPFQVLDALLECDAAPDVMEPVVAAVLGWDSGHPGADQWWEWLARTRFEAGDFAIAAAVRDAVPVSAASPRPAMLSIGASYGTAGLAAALGEAAVQDDLTADESRAVLALAAAELLAQGAGDLYDVLSLVIPKADAPWAKLAAIASGWWASAMRPLPADQLKSGAQQRQLEAGAAAGWDLLDAKLRAFELHSPPYKTGAMTQRFLVRAGGPLSLLKLAATQRDRAAVQAWLGDPALRDVGGWVDAATRESGCTELILGHLRPPFVERVGAIVAAARAIDALNSEVTPGHEPFDETVGAAVAVADKIRAELAALRSAAAGLTRPERALAEAALSSLDTLTGGEHE
jgi:phosphatidylserine/phosphatidylglycerophosphate/cardiolipin synthase-like enzyme